MLFHCEWGHDDYSQRVQSLPMAARADDPGPGSNPVLQALDLATVYLDRAMRNRLCNYALMKRPTLYTCN